MHKVLTTVALGLVLASVPGVAVADATPPPPDVCMTQRAYVALMARYDFLAKRVGELDSLTDAQAEAIARKDARIAQKNERIERQARLIKRLRAQLAG